MTEYLDNIIGVETKDVKPPKLPTIAQFVKQTKKPSSNPSLVIEIIWIPGKFDNYTLQTGKFRAIITPNHPFYKALGDIFRDQGIHAPPLKLRITDWETASYMLEESKGDKRVYKPMGNYGFKIESKSSTAPR